MARKLFIVSNRLPINLQKKRGEINYIPSVGGLATGLKSFYKIYESIWLGWPGIALNKIKKERDIIKNKLISDYRCYPIFLSQKDVETYYQGFCNKTIWPLFHYFTQYAIYDNALWKGYVKVNKLFCEAILTLAQDPDIIWIHDFHLMLLPQMIREKLFDVTIGFFLHIPFPSFEIFRLLPWRKDLLRGLLGADLIGFHTYDYTRHFLNSIFRLLGVDSKLGQIRINNRIVKVDTFPLGIEFEKFYESSQNPQVQKEINEIQKRVGKRKIILSIDRLDYTKGVPQRLEAFNTFLEQYPDYRNQVTLVCIIVPSRTKVEKYQELKRQTDELIGKINGTYGTIGWTPIWYLYRRVPFNKLVALYNAADIALVTPLRDGMNLIAKEYIASKRDGKGVLILSETAGAAKELGEAIIVNTNNKEEIVKAIERALSMPEEEQKKRNRLMQIRLRRYNVIRWAEEFIEALNSVKAIQKEIYTKKLTSDKRQQLIEDYQCSTQRLLLLDYDGTLIRFFDNPKDAFIAEELMDLLKDLTSDKKNTLVIISGRNKGELSRWFRDLEIDLVAEHGVWIKEKNKPWEMSEVLSNEWKKEIRPILELYADRTPGTFIEEKEYSLAWHYRKVDSELGASKAREIADVLANLIINYNLQIIEGNKVIEIKHAGINKGRAAQRWLAKKNWDFILAIGDDWTDEDLFGVLPKSAYSIKIGLTVSQAKYRLQSYQNVRILLKDLVESSKNSSK